MRKTLAGLVLGLGIAVAFSLPASAQLVAVTATGDVTGTSGTGANAGIIPLTIGAGKVTNTMLAGSIAASKLIGTDIATVGTITTGTWNGTVIAGQYGGTGINNSGKTITLGASLTTTGAGATTLAFGASTQTYTFPTTSKTILASDFSNVSGTLGVANGGTGTATTFTAGSVVYAGASGVYSQDNANFFWDATNHRLGIGTTGPAQFIHVSAAATAIARFTNTTNTRSADFGVIDDFNGGINVGSGGVFVVQLNGSEMFRITATGTGLGTTTSAPQALLSLSPSSTGFRNYNVGGAGGATDEWYENVWSSNVLVMGTNKGASGVTRGIKFESGGTGFADYGVTAGSVFTLASATVDYAICVGCGNRTRFSQDDTTGNFTISSVGTGTQKHIVLSQGGLVTFAGTTSSFPALKRSSTTLAVRLADDSADAPITASTAGFSGVTTINLNAAALPSAPTGTTVQIGQADSTNNRLTLDAFAGNTTVTFRRANGTAASRTALASGDTIGGFATFGSIDSSSYSSATRAGLTVKTTEAWDSTHNGTELDFNYTPTGGTATTTAITVNAPSVYLVKVFGSLETTSSFKVAGLDAGGASGVLLAGTTQALRIFTVASTSTNIEAVDNTGVASYQPLIVGGSKLSFRDATPTVQLDFNVTTASIWTSTAPWTFTNAAIKMTGITTGTNADTVCLKSDGTLLIQAAPCTISSERFKNMIGLYDRKDVLDVLTNLTPKVFTMKEDKDHPNLDPNFGHVQIGLTAENVAAVEPRCAIYEDDGKTPKSYRPECITALLIAGMQELRGGK